LEAGVSGMLALKEESAKLQMPVAKRIRRRNLASFHAWEVKVVGLDSFP
jgi:hypothetical protein